MGWGNGMAIGWPNSTSGRAGILTASIPYDYHFDLPHDYTLRWWGGTINPNQTDAQNIFFTCGPDLNVHSAFLINTGNFASPDFRFIYAIAGVVRIDVPIPDVLNNRWNFFCIERKDGRVYFALNGVWITSQGGPDVPVLAEGNPIFIGSNNTSGLLNGQITNFEWREGALYDTGANFTPPSSNLTANGDTILLVGIGTDLPGLKIDRAGNGHEVSTGSHTSFYQDDPWEDFTTGSFLFQ